MNNKGIRFFIIILAMGLQACEMDPVLPEESRIVLIHPDVNEVLIQGSICQVRWNAPGVESIRIDLYHGELFHSNIVEETDNTGEFLWLLSEDIPTEPGYSLRLSDANDPGLFKSSRFTFRVLAPGQPSSFTDERDGQVYSTVKLGDQWWLAENFNFRSEAGWYCYLNDTSFCSKVGSLYTRDAAMEIAPPGWHLPSDEEWKILEAYLGMSQDELHSFGARGRTVHLLLRPGSGSGFNGYFGGYYNSYVQQYGHITYESHYWSSSKDRDGLPFVRILSKNSVNRMVTSRHGGCSVRYVKDD